MKRYRLWPLILLGLLAAAPATQPARVGSDSMAAKCDQLVARWKNRLDAEHLHYLIAPPFVIAGDGSLAELERDRDGTILAAARAEHAMFFKKEPTEPVLVFLFESDGPYRRLSREWFDDEHLSPYGYFRQHDRVMMMNVSTGLGTLVHELTHALIQPDFPNVPDWFNEGLASLYEQSSIQGDRIEGHENWRLPALQRAIQENRLRPLKELLADDDFYGEKLVGINYAQARYLMMYLQEKGLLTRYYAEFRGHAGDDPTGEKSLEKVIAPQSPEDFERDWRAWVMRLKFQR